MREFLKRVEALLNTKIDGYQQQMYTSLLAGQREIAEHSAHRLAVLAELELDIKEIYKRLQDG